MAKTLGLPESKWWLLVYTFPEISPLQDDAFRPKLPRAKLIRAVLRAIVHRMGELDPHELDWSLAGLKSIDVAGQSLFVFTLHRPVSGEYKDLAGTELRDGAKTARRFTDVYVIPHLAHQKLLVQHTSHLAANAAQFARALDSMFRQALEDIHQHEYYRSDVKPVPEKRSFSTWMEQVLLPLDHLTIKYGGKNLPAQMDYGRYLTAALQEHIDVTPSSTVELKHRQASVTAGQIEALDNCSSEGHLEVSARGRKAGGESDGWSSQGEGASERSIVKHMKETRGEFLGRVLRMLGLGGKSSETPP